MLLLTASNRPQILVAAGALLLILCTYYAGHIRQSSTTMSRLLEKQTIGDGKIPVYVGGPAAKPAVIVLQGNRISACDCSIKLECESNFISPGSCIEYSLNQ
jgi:hypothetical protein